VGYPDLV
jgi:hypothetical protein